MNITSSNNINKYAKINNHGCVNDDIKIARSCDSGFKILLHNVSEPLKKNKKIKSDSHKKNSQVNIIKKPVSNNKTIVSDDSDSIFVLE